MKLPLVQFQANLLSDPDIYFSKELPLFYARQNLRFRVAQSLFSSWQVDPGTMMLLNSLTQSAPFEKILDLGCGYGVLGLALSAGSPGCIVHQVDRDALAVEYATQNAMLNGIKGHKAYGSLGYDAVLQDDFDLVVSNIPAKATAPVIASLVTDAQYVMRPEGLAAVVVVDAISELVLDILSQSQGFTLMKTDKSSSYTVFHYRLEKPHDPYMSGFQRGLYDSGFIDCEVSGIKYPMRIANGISGSNQEDSRTRLIAKTLKELGPKPSTIAMVVNPGQGHGAVLISEINRFKTIELVGRDLLSLEITRENLVSNGIQPAQITLDHKSVPITQPTRMPNLILIELTDNNRGQEVSSGILNMASRKLAAIGTIIVSGKSTTITRVEKSMLSTPSLLTVRRKRRKGNSILTLRRG